MGYSFQCEVFAYCLQNVVREVSFFDDLGAAHGFDVHRVSLINGQEIGPTIVGQVVRVHAYPSSIY